MKEKMKKRIIFKGVVSFVIVVFASLQVLAQDAASPEIPSSTAQTTGTQYAGVYKSGTAPFNTNTKVKIARSGNAYLFVPEKGEAWNLPIKSIRGAIVTATGVWFYWFDANYTTLNGYFQMNEGNTLFAADVNQAVKDAHQSQIDDAKLKADYEAYKEQALKESK